MVYVKLYMPFKKGQYVYNGLMFPALVLWNSSPKIITEGEWNYVITLLFLQNKQKNKSKNDLRNKISSLTCFADISLLVGHEAVAISSLIKHLLSVVVCSWRTL